MSWSDFGLLGIRPALGRDFSEADGRPGSPLTVIVSHGFWEARLGGRIDAVGRPIRLDGAEYMLVGVLPGRLGPPEQGQEFFVTQQVPPPARRGPFLYTVLARLRDRVDPAVAAEELHVISTRIFPIWKASYQDDKATWNFVDLTSHVVGGTSTTAGLALAAVALVWLIACANASSLLVARVASRRGELAVRAALGASRGRVVRFLLAESGLLALGSVAVGAAVAQGGLALLRGAGATYFPRMHEVAFDGPVVALLGGLAVMSGLIFGLVPAMHGTGASVDESLRSLDRTSRPSWWIGRGP